MSNQYNLGEVVYYDPYDTENDVKGIVLVLSEDGRVEIIELLDSSLNHYISRVNKKYYGVWADDCELRKCNEQDNAKAFFAKANQYEERGVM